MLLPDAGGPMRTIIGPLSSVTSLRPANWLIMIRSIPIPSKYETLIHDRKNVNTTRPVLSRLLLASLSCLLPRVHEPWMAKQRFDDSPLAGIRRITLGVCDDSSVC